MKIKEVHFTDEDECRDGYKISVETGTFSGSLSFLDGEPEDANLGRDFSDVYRISSLIEAAYYAGRHEEDLNMDVENIEDLDIF